ncbi:MAG: protein kinase [Acidobacteriota bacterium]
MRDAPRGVCCRAVLMLAAFVLLYCCPAKSLVAQEWYDDYSKGIEASQQGQWEKAVGLFEKAIEKNPIPGENVVTHGTNRLERYYPYIQLSRAYLMSGNIQGARQALARSIHFGKEPADMRARAAAAITEAARRARVAGEGPPRVVPRRDETGRAESPSGAPAPAEEQAAAGPKSVPSTAPQSSAAQPLLPAASGSLDLRSDPAGATVLIDGSYLGETPLKVNLAPGTHGVALRSEGFEESSFKVQISDGRLTTESKALVPAPGSASPNAPMASLQPSLLIVSQPPGATVYLDGELLGTTDPSTGRLVKQGVAPGAHELRLTMRRHARFSGIVDVGPTGQTTVNAVLSAIPSKQYSAVIIAAAAVLVVLGLVFVILRMRRQSAGATRSDPSRLSSVLTAADLETLRIGDSEVLAEATPFGEYRLIRMLGKGGMAIVFLAERKGEQCALKRPLAACSDDPEFRERFLREAEIGRTLHHPNIVRILERGEVTGMPYFTMELVNGMTLRARLRETAEMEPKAAALVVSQVAEALDYAHLKGVVHRDLKPSNIMLVNGSTVKVMDFGIARAARFSGITATGALVGTPDYIAPELIEGTGSDARSDLYSLGIVFYEMLTGRRPFDADTPIATIHKHCVEPPTPPSTLRPAIPPELEAVVLRLLSKNPDQRHPNAEELLIELREYLNKAA